MTDLLLGKNPDNPDGRPSSFRSSTIEKTFWDEELEILQLCAYIDKETITLFTVYWLFPISSLGVCFSLKFPMQKNTTVSESKILTNTTQKTTHYVQLDFKELQP